MLRRARNLMGEFQLQRMLSLRTTQKSATRIDCQ
jgi:hypothetical protein